MTTRIGAGWQRRNGDVERGVAGRAGSVVPGGRHQPRTSAGPRFQGHLSETLGRRNAAQFVGQTSGATLTDQPRGFPRHALRSPLL